MSQTFKCAAGHDSVDADFCSQCGNQLTPASVTAPAAIVSPSSAQTMTVADSCPKCSETRDGAAQYCGVCGYDFVSQTGGEVPKAAPPALATPSFAPPPLAPPVIAAAPGLSAARIDLEVVVAGGKARKHSLFDVESLIGRPNNKAALSLVIDGDEGISRKQMIITRTTSGATVRDLDSANGTAVERDGVKTVCLVGEEKEITVGDKIMIGEHTVVTVLSINF